MDAESNKNVNYWNDLGLIFGLKKELEKLQGTLSTINAVLLDAEEKQESSHAVKNWISRLEDVVYDADDLLDEFDYAILRQKVLARRQVRKFFSSSNPLAFGLKIGPRIKEITERLDAVAADISKYNLSARVTADLKAKNTERETASKVRSTIIGREKNKEHIIQSLLQEQIDHHGDIISIVAIVGFGGLGKTTLAQLVYNDAKVKNFFNSRIWVCVPEEFDVRIIFKKILESLGGSKVDDLDLDIYLRKLEENLEGKRYLLVLDDMWNESNSRWDDFSKHLVFGAPGSKILVTTRSKNVASTMGVNVTHFLKVLNEDQSWALFELVAFEGQGQMDQNLKIIGQDVAQKCKGVPLTIKCLGGLMRQNPNEKYWLSIKENEIWKLRKEDDDVFPFLRLSYIHLPSHLKQCFAFCSIFPKDFKISKDLLIQSWRAQGYIQLRGNENIQDIGDEYFNDLLSRFFFEEEEKDVYGNIIYCKMHDLIHDLALSTAKSSFYWMKDVKEKIPSRVRHVSLEEIPKEEISKKVVSTLLKAKGIRTVYFESYHIKNLFIRNVTFSSFNCLRMLNLSYMNIVVLPNSIGKLKHLKYLDLSDNRMEVLPNAIAKLHSLQTLLLCHCSNLKELPKDIRQLINLEYLNIDLCNNLKCLPKGLGELTSLQRLSRFIVNSVEKNFSIAATLNELRDLNDLGKYLCIENINKVRNVELESMEAILKEKKRLQSLRLEWNCYARGDKEKDELLLDNLKPHQNLKGLMVYGYGGARFSTWLSSLSNLVELHIDRCRNCQHLPPLDHLSSLKSFTLQGFHVLKHLPPLDHMLSLKSLTLQGFHVLEHLPSLDHLSSLESLTLQGFHVLEHLPPLDHLSSLKSLSLHGFRVLEHLPPLDHLSSLKSLALQGFHVLKHLPPLDHLSSLKSLFLRGFRVLEHLPPLDHLSSLKFLSLQGFRVLEHLPPLDHLSSLKSLSLNGFRVLEHLPPLDHLSSLESLILQEFHVLEHVEDSFPYPCSTPRTFFPSLKKLLIRKCLNLQGWWRIKKENKGSN
ncbi:Leucine-rich repeat containing protein, putative [Theobroma cacao]|uniref:Leucine-rich repeat containing protein, putative n=1 Tax=Theobroma cacao TaxID=3641 RepID=A0A061FDF3_THECC|nr:Leucine-rich repeat containing protein, putative [Theobroma cacao]